MQFNSIIGKSTIDESQFDELHLTSKYFINKYQKLLVSFFNSTEGRQMFAIKHDYPILKVDPSGWHYCVGIKGHKLQMKADLRGYDIVNKKLGLMLLKLDIAQSEYFRKTVAPNLGLKALQLSAVGRHHPLFPHIFLVSNEPYYGGAGDGYVGVTGGGSWNSVWAASSGNLLDYTSTENEAGVVFTDHYWIYRAFFPIDTSGLPDDASISAAILHLWGTSKQDNAGDNATYRYVNIVQTSQSSNTVLATSDYPSCGAAATPTTGSTQVSIGGFSTGAYNDFTLNSTGRGWIVPTGYSKFGVREGFDANGDTTQKNGDHDTAVRVNMATSEDSTTSDAHDPYISISYDINDEMIYAAGKSSLKHLSFFKRTTVKI